MLIGRAEEIELLMASLEQRPCSIVVFGAPGMGKTSLCEVVARKAGASARVAWGRAWEFGGAPPFFPWLRVVRALIEQTEDNGGRLTAIAARLESGTDDADARARFSLFEAVRRALVDASLGTPLLIVLDDVHAADGSTLQLARYLQRELGDVGVALLMTAREIESSAAREPARTLLTDLARDATRTLRLGGLDETALSEWLPWFCGRRAPDGLAGKLKELTGGNPFLVRELVAAQRGDLEAIVDGRPELPRTGREVIQKQVAFLDGFTHEVLRVAAALGRSAEVGAVARVLGRSSGEVLAAREVAIAARLVTASEEGSLRFAHSLIADALYAELTPARRREIHAAIVEALPSSRVSERARHALEAARLGAEHAEEAFSLCREAGAQAHRALAFEEATRHLANAIAVASAANVSPLAIAEVHVAQGEAWLASGNKAEAARALELGATLAVPIDAREVLARAAIGLAATREYMQRDVAKLELLELALVRLGDDESELAARVMARLATDLAMQPDSKARRAELSARALAIARRAGAPETIALALEARLQAVYGADSVQERVMTGGEIQALARKRGDVERELAGLGWQLSGLLEGGDVLAARALAADHARLADGQRMAGPRINAQSRLAMLAFLGGRFDEGFAHAGSARAIGLAAKDAAADLLFHAQLVVPCDLLGRHAPLEEALGTLAREGPRAIHGSAIQALHARGLLALGRLDEARARIVALGARGFADIPDDFVRMGTLASLADTVVRLGDAALAQPLECLLAPYPTQNAMIGTAASLGAVSLYLGRLARLTGRNDEAMARLRSAREQNAAMQAWPWLAWSEFELAASLSARDAERSRLLESAQRRAMELGMAPLLESLARAGEASNASESTTVAHESQTQRAVLRRQGKGWSLSLEGRAIEIGGSRGLSYVARLCERLGQEIHALELASDAGAPQDGAADTLLDPQTKAALRARLRDLRAAIDDAERTGDSERERRARQELDALETSLAAALGLGGRSRKHGSTAERARIAVTVAIRRALASMSRQAPAVSAHLTRSIRTGLFCMYDPDPTSKMRVETEL